MRRAHSIEHQKCKYCVGGTAEELGILSFELEESLHAEEANLGGYLVYNQSLHANAKRAPALLSQH